MTREQIEDKIFKMCKDNLTPDETIEMLIVLSGSAALALNYKTLTFGYEKVEFELNVTKLK